MIGYAADFYSVDRGSSPRGGTWAATRRGRRTSRGTDMPRAHDVTLLAMDGETVRDAAVSGEMSAHSMRVQGTSRRAATRRTKVRGIIGALCAISVLVAGCDSTNRSVHVQRGETTHVPLNVRLISGNPHIPEEMSEIEVTTAAGVKVQCLTTVNDSFGTAEQASGITCDWVAAQCPTG